MEEEKLSTQQTSFVEYEGKYEPLPWVDKNGFPHWVMAVVWYLLALIIFNIVGSIVAVVGVIATADDPSIFSSAEAVLNFLNEQPKLVLFGNTVGQIMVIGLLSLLVAQFSSVKGKRASFLRLKTDGNTWKFVLLAMVLMGVSFPLTTFLGWINSFVPQPVFFEELQDASLELLSSFLKSENALILGLIYIGVTPAVCEEIMFRGYIQRSLEKSGGIWMAIIVSGIMFGAYHMQITNLLPLSFIGILLAYLTYISESIIPAMFAHFANNGSQVILSGFYPEMLDEEITPDSEMPLLLIIGSIIVTSVLIYLLYQMKLKTKPDTEA